MIGDVWVEKDAKGVVVVCIDKGNGEVAKKTLAKAKIDEAKAGLLFFTDGKITNIGVNNNVDNK